MEIFIEDKDLSALEACMEIADPGEDSYPHANETFKSGNSIVEGLRMLLPRGSDKRLRVVVE